MVGYWARAEARARRRIDGLDLSSWLDYWHTHVDWHGRGNARPDGRADVAAATFRVLQYLEQLAQARQDPIQIWATLCENTMDNAVFAHSPNPNGTPYPNDFDGAQWDAPVPGWVSAAIADDSHQVGAVSDGDAIVYLVRRRRRKDS